jgi:hypothetical protein
MTLIRLTEIDDLLRPEHYYVQSDDRVYFFRELIVPGDYSASATNQLISNLKIPVTEKRRLPYKRGAIKQCAQELTSIFPADLLDGATFVPIPPSESKDDPAYDDRLMQILSLFHKDAETKDFREIVTQSTTTRKSHCSGPNRMKVDELMSVYQINKAELKKARNNVIIFDDVLTAGAHFRAMKNVLTRARPDLFVIGLFIARVIRPTEEPPVWTPFVK